MADLSPRQRSASEFEQMIAAGDEAAISQLVSILGPPLHRHLSLELPQLLNREDRDDLMMTFIADIIGKHVVYNPEKASFITFAKICVYRRAIDLLRKRGSETQRDFGFGLNTLLRLSQQTPLDGAEFAEAVERARVSLDAMPANHAAAVEARQSHGRDGYKEALVRKYGISSDLAAQWLHRGLEALSEATGLAAEETK